jgi:putative ABC transport system permease protein
MFRNYLSTALNNLARNPVHAAISILGLAAAFTAAILIAQFVRGEFSYDRWVPGYQQVYKITGKFVQPGEKPGPDNDATQAQIAGQLRAVMPRIIAARLMESFPAVRRRAGDPSILERNLAWADPDFFKVFPLPALAGDPRTALQQPGTVAITRSAARKYFGRDAPIGDTLQVLMADWPPPGSPPGTQMTPSWRPLRVTAVLKDLPSATNLTTEIFAAGQSPYSDLRQFELHGSLGQIGTYTFVRLAPGQTATELQRSLDIAGKPENALFASIVTGGRFGFHAMPIAQAHLSTAALTFAVTKPVGSEAVAYEIAAVGALIVLVAAINFITLMTARAGRRGVEVGVRKASGARRSDLVVQFMGEALIQVALAVLIALALAELLEKPFSAFVQRELTLDLLKDPLLLPGVLATALLVGLLASIYPAFVLSSFRPAAVLKGGAVQTTGSAIARQALVVVQFAILVGLIVTAATIYRQTRFALAQGVGGAETSKLVAVFTACDNAFPEEVRRLPGVAAAACSSLVALNTPNAVNIVAVQLGGGRKETFHVAPVDFAFFDVYGIRPLAGRLFRPDHGEDRVLEQPDSRVQPTVVINETAARDLGFSNPRDAIGRQMTWDRFVKPGTPDVIAPSTIVGVAPDLPMNIRSATAPTMYFVRSRKNMGVLSVRMTGHDIPGTLRAMAEAYRKTGDERPIDQIFLEQTHRTLYMDVIIQGSTIAACALLAVLIACLGLLALSAYTTERRTKEIGIRKVMGASTSDVVKLLVWQFTVPVLWAISIALPLSFMAMQAWLHGFVYRVDQSPWTYALAAAAALAIAWATVTWQSYSVARAKPAGALRYE